MSKALEPFRRLVGQFNARIANLRALPATNIPPAPPHVHAPPPASTTHSVPFSTQRPVFGQFQVRVAIPSHQDGPVLLAHLNQKFNSFARNFFVPEPVRVAAVDYACRNAGRPHIASLLSKGALFHQSPRFGVPHGFVKNVGFFSSRGFSSTVGPTMSAPVNMMAQMYSKPFSSLVSKTQMINVNECHQYKLNAKKRHQMNHESNVKRRNKSCHGGFKKHVSVRIHQSTVQKVLARAAAIEQQHQIMSVCNVNSPITAADAISLAKVAGKSIRDLDNLPKLNSYDDCPTNVDMCFILDASPLWHLDTMVSALHTDSLKAPKELNGEFIQDLLQVTNAQYQHFMEVSAILQSLTKCREVREVTLEGYELRVHFNGTTLFDVIRFLRELSIDPNSPHFTLEEVYVDGTQEQYFPQASVNDYYAESIADNDTWDDCNSLQSSFMYTDSERCSSVASFATMDSLPEHASPWETLETESQETEESVQEVPTMEVVDIIAEVTETPVFNTDGLFLEEEPSSLWKSSSSNVPVSADLEMMSSKILNTSAVTEEYFDDIRGFLERIENIHRHSEKLFGSPLPQM